MCRECGCGTVAGHTHDSGEGHTHAHGVVALNLMSSPGAGKTLLLERTLERLRDRIPAAVITGDLQTDNDARRLQGKGAAVRQIETVNACHLSAAQIGALLPEVAHAGERLLFIENVGNKVNPGATILQISAKTGAGMDAWIAYLEDLVAGPGA